jgi:hypothetical protein
MVPASSPPDASTSASASATSQVSVTPQQLFHRNNHVAIYSSGTCTTALTAGNALGKHQSPELIEEKKRLAQCRRHTSDAKQRLQVIHQDMEDIKLRQARLFTLAAKTGGELCMAKTEESKQQDKLLARATFEQDRLKAELDVCTDICLANVEADKGDHQVQALLTSALGPVPPVAPAAAAVVAPSVAAADKEGHQVQALALALSPVPPAPTPTPVAPAAAAFAAPSDVAAASTAAPTTLLPCNDGGSSDSSGSKGLGIDCFRDEDASTLAAPHDMIGLCSTLAASPPVALAAAANTAAPSAIVAATPKRGTRLSARGAGRNKKPRGSCY